ncbi:hypothetical protein [Nocardia bovistercoris]|uniref:Uncharacterized protein n=1 Tax=Nocardia bovistercoris TaxID=2785916 RepID=A0A931N1T4_9NOCA|nr:hypothetical protein [Nocardia bovistercoris]MBH0776254.1 hypothetical protein [Nocardia bovistercoris]
MSNQGESSGPATVGQWIARAVAVLILVPVRLLWEGVKLSVRVSIAVVTYFLEHLLVPLCVIVWNWVIKPAWHLLKDGLWGWLLQQVLWGLVLTPVLAFLLDFVLRPLRRAVEDWLWRRILVPAGAWLWRRVVRPMAAWLWRWVLRPLGKIVLGVCVLAVDWLLVRPVRALWRWVLRPLWRALRVTLRFGWRVATVLVGVLIVTPCVFVYRRVLAPVFAALAVVWNVLVARPVRWTYVHVVTPMNRWASEIVTGVFGR